MKTIPMIVLAGIMCISSTCTNEGDNCHKTIQFINNSDMALYVIWCVTYPDTTCISHIASPELNDHIYKIKPKESSSEPFFETSCWESILKGIRIPSDTLMVYVFDADVVENNDWVEVSNQYMILKRYDLSLGDLKKNDFTITYPPR